MGCADGRNPDGDERCDRKQDGNADENERVRRFDAIAKRLDKTGQSEGGARANRHTAGGGHESAILPEHAQGVFEWIRAAPE